jgi:parallel beta-helix repeat protein
MTFLLISLLTLSISGCLGGDGDGSGGSGTGTASITSIYVTPPASTMARGTTQQYTMTAIYSDGTTSDVTAFINATSSDEAYAIINSGGIVNAIAPGTVTITANYEGKTGTANLTVTSAYLVSISVTPVNSNIAMDSTQQFTATGHYSDGNTQDITASVTWDSSSPSTASINAATGLSTAVDFGSSTITTTDPSTSIFASTTLTVDGVAITALYPNNGANWNDYVAGGNITNATDMACDADNDSACINGGLIRTFEVPGVVSCTNITAEDDQSRFNWTCDESTTPVWMISTGLKDGASLSDLIDFNNSMWLNKYVVVYDDGLPVLTTAYTRWWDNTIEIDNDGGYLDTAGTIYTVTASNNNNYIINSSSVGLVVKSGAVINGTDAGGNVIASDGSAEDLDFLYIEGTIDATGDDKGIYLKNVRFSMLNNITANGANTGSDKAGVYIEASTNNTLTNITASNNSYYGVYLLSSSNNTLTDIIASSSGFYGVLLYSSSNNNTLTDITASSNNSSGVGLRSSSNNNTLTDITASNNNVGVHLFSSSNNTLTDITVSYNVNLGVYLQRSSNNTLADITASNHTKHGVYLYSSSNNTLTDITASDNGQNGVWLFYSSNNNTLSDIIASSNSIVGVYLETSSNNTLADITASDNNYGVALEISSDNYFTGLLKVGNNVTKDCSVAGGTNPGFVDTTCTTTGTNGSSTYNAGDLSDATLTNSVSVIGSFVASAAGDYSLVDTDIVIRGVLALPTGDDTLTHTWSDGSPIVLLRHAVEIQGDEIGNDNNLCESGEDCLYTPNIAAYQGHGNLVSAGAFTDGTLTGITLWKYETNGY